MISIGDYQLELSTHQLFYKQELLKVLSPKDFKLLYQLSEPLNQPVSREKLFQEIWEGQEAHDSLNNSISRLRKLLERDTTLSIDAVKGIGYILQKKTFSPHRN
ncbi:winged helix-turn-helix domain-containing protein [Parabacteroides distasonis]|uniref:winged helix-turn-helix domain-containing protein n=1 Tax=Parabacteroides distasonis TaxID=823 RepID=UPI00359C7EB6